MNPYFSKIFVPSRLKKHVVFTFDMSLNVCNLSFVFFFTVPIASGVDIDVWIQGEKTADGFIFHDETPFPADFNTFCPLGLGGYPTETRVRAHGYSTFECWDRGQDVPFSYLCEYYLRFTL